MFLFRCRLSVTTAMVLTSNSCWALMVGDQWAVILPQLDNSYRIMHLAADNDRIQISHKMLLN